MCTKFAIITGASSGLGLHLAKHLFPLGVYEIVLACRSSEKANAAITEIIQFCQNKEQKSVQPPLKFINLDLSSLTSVENFVQDFSKLCPTGGLHLLVNNAGIMNHPHDLTSDGLEIHFQTNYLGHFHLTNLLKEFLSPNARILNITSGFYEKCQKIPSLEELTDKNKILQYKPSELYSISKLANCLHVISLEKIFKTSENMKNVKVVAIRPGFIRGTELGRYTNALIRMIISPLIWFVAKDLDEGISTTYYCIVECNDEQLTTASLYYKKQIIPFTDSVSVENAENLWQMSEKFVTKYHENKK